jgi:hypothetical protein
MPDSHTLRAHDGEAPRQEGMVSRLVTEKAETILRMLRLPHFSQDGFSSPKTNASKVAPHFLH